MATQDNEPEQRVVAVVLISLIALIIAGVLGLGVFKARGDKAAPAASATAAPRMRRTKTVSTKRHIAPTIGHDATSCLATNVTSAVDASTRMST